MAGIIDLYLKRYGVTRYQAASLGGLQASTLVYANKKPVKRMSVQVVQALALATHKSPGKTLDELLKLEGNPIINFIQQHPSLDKELVQRVEDQLITIHQQGGKLSNVTFNRYESEGEDTPARAEAAMQNLTGLLTDVIKEHEHGD